MEQRHKDCLQKNRVYLVENVDFGQIRDFLVGESIITSSQEEMIASKVVQQDKTRELLNLLPRAGPRAFGLFLRALDKAEPDYGHVIDKLQRYLRGEDSDDYDEPDSLGFPVQEGKTGGSSSMSPQLSHSSSASGFPRGYTDQKAAAVPHTESAPALSSGFDSFTSASTYDDCTSVDQVSLLDKLDDAVQENQRAVGGACNWEPPTWGMRSLSVSDKKSDKYDFLQELSEEQKSTCPEERLFGSLAPLLPDIDVLGLNLGFPRVKLQQIKSNNPHNVVNQAIDLLADWRHREYRKATIKRLVRAYQKSNLPIDCYKDQILEYFYPDSD